jgi:hypothetical protein
MIAATTALACCDTAYKYDIENAFDDHTSDITNVTLVADNGIDASMYYAARIFPGLVDTATERRVDTTISLDMSFRHANASELLAQYVPQPIYSTGLYAGAGEQITVTIDEDIIGLTVQTGSHTTDLTTEGSTVRDPIVYTRKALFCGKNTIRNPYGGYIWILRDNNTRGTSDLLPVKIEGAYPAPDFIGGQTDPEVWKNRINTTTVPWLELRGKRVAFSVPRSRMVEAIRNDASFHLKLTDVLNSWDKIVENYFYRYYALERNAETTDFRAPDYPERVVLDVQLSGSLPITWGGQPVVAINSNYMLDELCNPDIVNSGLSTAVVVSISNNYSPTRSPFWSDVSTAASVIPQYRIMEKNFLDGTITEMPDIFTAEGQGINVKFPEALVFVANDSAKIRQSVSAYDLLFFAQIAHYNNNDWTFYESLMKKIRENTGGFGFFASGSISTFYSSLCDYFKRNFAPMFDHYGYVIPDRVRTEIDNKDYPLIDKTIWRYNPLSSNPAGDVGDYDNSKYRYYFDRSAWTVMALDANFNDNFHGETRRPELTIDGSISTWWHTNYSVSPLPPLPHYMVYDMQEKQTVAGLFIARGTADRPIRRIIVEIYEGNNEIDVHDKNIVWKQIGEIRPFYEQWQSSDGFLQNGGLPRSRNELRFFDLAGNVSCRYIRLKLTDVCMSYGFISKTDVPDPNVDLTKVTTLYNSFAEFGTYYYK